ncbi:MAG: hypothetical protein ACT4ON_04365 [Bacteroidota bacterium]
MRLLFLFLFFTFSASAQFSKHTKQNAKENIKQLKEGALFVRLKTSELKINALEARGMKKEAEEIRINQEKENKAIADAFKHNYTFSKVYFFYSNHSTEVKEGRYRQHLMNSDLQIDSSFIGTFLIGEFDESQNELKAFFIKDRNYVPLDNPFPFLIKLNKMLVSTKSEVQIAKELNTKLFDFWKKQ